MNDRRYDILEDYLIDLQADRPSAVFAALGDDKELAVVLRTAKTVHLLTRRPNTNDDFAESLEGRLLIQAEDMGHAGRQRLRWGFALPALAVIGVGFIMVWQVVTPGSAPVESDSFGSAVPISAKTPSRAVDVAALEVAGDQDVVVGNVWEELEVLEGQIEQDFSEIETTMATVDNLFNSIDYGSTQVELTSISY